MTVVQPSTGVDLEVVLKALSSSRRLQILHWLTDPAAHFPSQEHGDPNIHGACNQFIGDKLGISQPAASRHLKVLSDADLIVATPRQGWIYYRRNEEVLNQAKRQIGDV
jgi:DNA-binding transcriptional ArsR family regulator